MSTEQLTLAVPSPAPKVKPEQVRAVLVVLRRNRDWMTAPEIAAELGHQTPAFERLVRRCASVAAPSIVSYPGSPGYKFWDFCSVEEIDHCINSFEAQGKDMIKRANVYRLAYHRKHREPAEGHVQEALALG
jgi:hypothetical protein